MRVNVVLFLQSYSKRMVYELQNIYCKTKLYIQRLILRQILIMTLFLISLFRCCLRKTLTYEAPCLEAHIFIVFIKSMEKDGYCNYVHVTEDPQEYSHGVCRYKTYNEQQILHRPHCTLSIINKQLGGICRSFYYDAFISENHTLCFVSQVKCFKAIIMI